VVRRLRREARLQRSVEAAQRVQIAGDTSQFALPSPVFFLGHKDDDLAFLLSSDSLLFKTLPRIKSLAPPPGGGGRHAFCAHYTKYTYRK
jgi:hypothetical protein